MSSDSTDASNAPQQPFLRRLLSKIFSTPGVGPLIILIIAVAYFQSQNPRFIDLNTFSLILQQNSWIAALALGQTIIILTAGIDLSNGSVMAFGAVVMAGVAVNDGVTPIIALGVGFSVTMAFGLLHGLLVTRLKLPPFIVTLGTLNIAFAMTRIYTTSSISGLPDIHLIFGERVEIFGTRFTYGSIFVVVLFILTWLMLRYTAFGRYIYAIGDDPEAARLTGIPVERVLIAVYMLAGFFYAFAAWMFLGRFSTGDPNAAQTANLDSITAVVIGGVSLFGGRGSVIGPLIGALTVGVISTGLQATGVNILYQRLITGILVIIAVAIDQYSQRRGS